MHLISQLEGKLKAAIHLQRLSVSSWVLSLNLMYDGHPAGSLSFNLDGYDADEAQTLAKNVSGNAFLMREIDEHLWGESD